MKLMQEKCLFVMIDMQTAFADVIDGMSNIIARCNTLNKAAQLLNIPLLVTEQYPKGLGHTMPQMFLPDTAKVYSKTKFSIFTEDVTAYLMRQAKPILVLYGVEAHVCLTQTALEAIEAGFEVFVVVDAVGSRRELDYKTGLSRMRAVGCQLVTTEMLLFEILGEASHPQFKEISRLVK